MPSHSPSNKPKILLFHCSRYNRITPIISMGLWGMADYLTRNGFPTTIIHTGVEEELNGRFDIKDYLHDGLLMVGFSLHWFPAAPEIQDLSTQIKELNPDLYIVLGGLSAGFFRRDIIKEWPVDGVIRGDGEMPMLLLARALEHRQESFEDIPNLTWRSDNEIIENDVKYLANNAELKDVSFGQYSTYLRNYEAAKHTSLVNQYSYFQPDFYPDYPIGSVFYLLTGKGCEVNCTMCGGGKNAQFLINGRDRSLFMDDDIILRTVKEGIAHGYKTFYTCFDPRPDDPRYFSWLRRIQEEKLDINLFFGFWGLPTEEAIDELKKTSHNLLIDISPETIGERCRKKNKGINYTNKELYDCLDMLFEKKVYTHVYFSYFLPFQTVSELDDTRRAYWEINSKYPHYIEGILLKISTDPASPLYLHPEKFNTTLTAPSFSEHVQACRDNHIGNVLVHELNNIPKETQRVYERKFQSDPSLKRLFKYNVKLLIKAFPSVDSFIEFLDGFYIQLGILDLSQTLYGRTTDIEILESFAAYARRAFENGLAAEPYLINLIDYVVALVRAAEAQPPSPPPAAAIQPEEALNRMPRLAAGVSLLNADYNLHQAREQLVSSRRYSPIEPSPIMLLIGQNQNQVQIHAINETLFLLCGECSNTRSATGREIIENVTNMFDAGDIKPRIEKDLTDAMLGLVRHGFIEMEKSPQRSVHHGY